jgi:hypothetical protein
MQKQESNWKKYSSWILYSIMVPYYIWFFFLKEKPKRISYSPINEKLIQNESEGIEQLLKIHSMRSYRMRTNPSNYRLDSTSIRIIYNSTLISTSDKIKIIQNNKHYKSNNQLYTELFDCYIDEDSLNEIESKPIVYPEIKGENLVFKSMDEFQNFMSLLTNTSINDIENYEKRLGFNSLRYQNDRIKEFEMPKFDRVEKDRIDDPYFESILSNNESVVIGDTLYMYDLMYGKVTAKNVHTDSTITHNFRVSAGSRLCRLASTADSKEICLNEEMDETCIFLSVRNWSRYYYLYSSLGVSVSSFKIKPNGKLERYESPTLQLSQKHGECVQFSFCNLGSKSTTIENQYQKEYNSYRCLKVFDFTAGYDSEPLITSRSATIFSWLNDLWDLKLSTRQMIRKRRENKN